MEFSSYLPRFILISHSGLVKTNLPPVRVSHVKLEFSHFHIVYSGTPLALDDGNSMSCMASLRG
jgi:hypothetical protein